ncbi:MAG: transporter substrate-binding domain-containing protein, partial [Victivallaceae bacterium]
MFEKIKESKFIVRHILGGVLLAVSIVMSGCDDAKKESSPQGVVNSATPGGSHKKMTSPGPINSLKDLQGKSVASMTGSGFQELTAPLQPGINYLFFNDNHSSVAALRAGKIDAVLLDKPIAQLFSARFSQDIYFACVYAKDYYGFAFRKGSSLVEPASRVIHKLKESGEMEQLIAKWCGGDDAK